MPIGDLLAQITGGSAPPPPPKRKATDDIRSPVPAKTQRTAPSASNGTPRPVTDPRAAQRPYQPSPATSNATPRPAQASRPSADRPSSVPMKSTTSNSLGRELSASSNSARTTTSTTLAKRPTQPPAKAPTPIANAAPKAPPKKGSYKYLMERAKRVQEERAAEVGTGIRHKAMEKAPLKSQLKADAAIAEIRKAKAGPSNGSGYAGTARAGGGDRAREDRNGDRLPMRNGHATPGAAKGGKVGSKLNGKGVKDPPVEEKKVKKAAIATTGYQGTARGPAKTDKPSASGAAGAKPKHRMPFGQRPRRRDDEYDEDMDDFIDDDEGEEEDGYGYGYGREPKYRYAGDEDEDESDMEAGMTDIEEEDRRAERAARREDAEQEALEQRHRADKARKKELWAARRKAA